MRHLIAACTLLLLAACASEKPTTVASADAAAPAAAPEAAASAPKMVCHREEQTGSHMNHTVCEPENQDHTAGQDAARAWADQDKRVNPSAVKTTGH